MAEYNGTGTLKARYTQSLGIDQPISMTRGTSTSYYHFDGLGSVIALTDSSQNVTDTYTYDAFGNIIETTGTTVNPFRFTGRELDPDSGLMYYRTRYYSPSIGRFITQDLLRGNIYDPLSLNRYVYTRNNPVNWADPFGLEECKSWKEKLKEYWEKFKEWFKSLFPAITETEIAREIYKVDFPGRNKDWNDSYNEATEWEERPYPDVDYRRE